MLLLEGFVDGLEPLSKGGLGVLSEDPPVSVSEAAVNISLD
jgi:hypothetical protein